MHQTDTPSFDFFKDHQTAVMSAKCVGEFQHKLLYMNDRDDLCLLFSVASLQSLEIRLWAPREFHKDLYERSIRLCNALRANSTLEGIQVVAEESCVDIMSRMVFDSLQDKICRFWGDPQPCALLRARTSVLEHLTIDSHDSHNFSDLCKC
ncbi:hypothetical protein M3Y99_00827400 [Aphelenchoides fujianensis]|nr:hypothetical protein M3Y99_00827400 [Aphelenchoides fujianensis]